MRPETAAAIYSMSQATDRIAEAVRDKNLEDVEDDWILLSALERQFEIPGEALARVRAFEQPVYEQVPEGDKIIGLRNLLAHGYDAVDSQVLWALAETKLDELRNILTRLLDEAQRQGL